MSFSMTKLSAALLLTSSLVGCAAMVKTPYQAPSVQVPGSFQYDATKTKQHQSSNILTVGGRFLTMLNSTSL